MTVHCTAFGKRAGVYDVSSLKIYIYNFAQSGVDLFEPCHDKSSLCHMRRTKAVIRVRINTVRSMPWLFAAEIIKPTVAVSEIPRHFVSFCNIAGRFARVSPNAGCPMTWLIIFIPAARIQSSATSPISVDMLGCQVISPVGFLEADR